MQSRILPALLFAPALFVAAHHPSVAQTPPLPPAPPQYTAPPTAEPAPGPSSSPAADADAIRNALFAWMSAFNNRDENAVCNLFAPDLQFDFGSMQNGTFAELCDRLQRALHNPGISYQYALEVREILISGDLAIVRLAWTLTITRRAQPNPVVEHELGMDVMRHEPNGAWRIFRFVGYNVPREPMAQRR